MNDRTVTPKENTSVQGIYSFPDFTVKTCLFCAIVCASIQFINNTKCHYFYMLDVSHLLICFPAGRCYEGDGHLPLFQTGLGRSVTVSKSSIKRASAILEPRNIAKELEGTSCSKHHISPFCNCRAHVSFLPDKHVFYCDFLR